MQMYKEVRNWPAFTKTSRVVAGHLPLVPPVNLNAIMDRITPNISTFIKVYTLPVLGSGRKSSNIFPRDIAISCCFEPEKFPCTAWVMAVDPWRVRLYKNIPNRCYPI